MVFYSREICDRANVLLVVKRRRGDVETAGDLLRGYIVTPDKAAACRGCSWAGRGEDGMKGICCNNQSHLQWDE